MGMIRAHCTQADLAKTISRSQVAVSRRLSGKVPWSAEELDAVSAALGITLVIGSAERNVAAAPAVVVEDESREVAS